MRALLTLLLAAALGYVAVATAHEGARSLLDNRAARIAAIEAQSR